MKLMIDLETLGTTQKAHVLSMGLAFFDDTGVVFSRHMLLPPQGQENRERSYSTVMWWVTQAVKNPDAAKALLVSHEEGYSVGSALCQLRDDIATHKPTEVWANSPTFDCAILRDLYDHNQMATPWQFWTERDFRTLKAVANSPAPAFDGVQHNAEADAIHQARCVNHWLGGIEHVKKHFRETTPGYGESRHAAE